MIDINLLEKLMCERAEIKAEIKVESTIFEFAKVNSDRCKDERNFMEMQAWHDVMRTVCDKLLELAAKYDKVVKQIKEET